MGHFGFTPTGKLAGGVAGFLIWLALWQLLTTAGPLAGVSGIPTMSGAVGEGLRVIFDPDFWVAIGQTLGMALTGLGLAIVLGVTVGLATAVSRAMRAALDPTIQFLRPLPPIVILPLLLMVLGPTWSFGVALAAFGAIWPIVLQVQIGIRDVDPVMLETARSMNLPWHKVQTSIVLPSAAPFIITGIRIGATFALLLAIGAGLLGGAPGLGRRILIAQEALQSDLAFGLILWSGVIGTFFAQGLNALEQAVLRGRRPIEEPV
ncbi:MAG TPA: ABC transporter permease subunit [Shinella sp.]|jgi:ABC-type nitrate/sulfonate/bicarbonate transport system permease component|uniref:ABC transporter permease n=1 Tax=Shinella sp. TaxID=1870904 RepID=UPI002E13C50B|nr:ABC transporter permease subunit [Shinella sp.]